MLSELGTSYSDGRLCLATIDRVDVPPLRPVAILQGHFEKLTGVEIVDMIEVVEPPFWPYIRRTSKPANPRVLFQCSSPRGFDYTVCIQQQRTKQGENQKYVIPTAHACDEPTIPENQAGTTEQRSVLFPSLALPRSFLTRDLSTAGLGITGNDTALFRLLQVVLRNPLFLVST
jgi:hypothetical protein